MRRCSPLVLLLLLTTGTKAQLPVFPGVHELALPESGRPYTLSIPEGYSEATPAPLVLSLHYGGRVTPHFGRGLLEILVEPALRDLGAIIVAPDSAPGGWTDSASVGHVIELLDYIEANYNIDADRTLVTGYSMGGAGTWHFAPRYPERFAAALPMAARPERNLDEFSWETPMYVIHSTADERIALEPARSAVEHIRANGGDVEFAVIDGITHFQMALYQPHLRAAIPWIRRVWGE